MLETDLLQLGFNKNEAKVYLALIEIGTAGAYEIIQKTKFHKNIVYDNLSKLIDKGLITYIVEENRRLYRIAPSNMLVGLFENKEKDILRKKKLACKLSKEIDTATQKRALKQEATIYRGIKGIKSFYSQTLDGPDFVVFGAPKESVEIMGEHFWQNYNLKVVENKIKIRMIFNSSLREFGKKFINKYTKIRYFGKQFEPRTETHVQGDKVAIIVWSIEPILFLMEDALLAQDYRKFFKEMWNQAQVPG